MSEKGSRKSSPEDFYLDEKKLDEGVQLPLRGRDGRLTKEWLRVRSLHSDGYQAAVSSDLKRYYEENPERDLPLGEREIIKRFRHHLVTSWSFDAEFSEESVRELLDRNPSIAQAVVEVASRSSLFFPDAGESSSPGPKGK